MENVCRRCEMTPWDLAMLSTHYIQKGLLFHYPSQSLNQDCILIANRLKESLSQLLVHFFPLAGRLATEHNSSSSSSSSVFIDCNGAGAEFIHAAVDMTLADVLTPTDVPPIVKSFFTFDGAVNHDGHSIPLIGVQLTQLVDGFFIGCSFNHAMGDGTSFWHFFNSWSEITRKTGGTGYLISNPPLTDRWFPDCNLPPIQLPFSHPSEFLERFAPPTLRERIFHFSPKSIALLKGKANEECQSNNISSFQALCALVWRSITRARRFPADQKTNCRLAIGNRPRLQPPLSPHYFGNCLHSVAATTTVAELLSHNLGWAARSVHESVIAHTDAVIRGTLDKYVKAPFVFHLSGFDQFSVMMGSSPRFNMYGNDFGWGRPVAVLSGNANKFDGKVTSYPGREGGGSVDLEICLPQQSMSSLELDEEFMNFVSPSVVL